MSACYACLRIIPPLAVFILMAWSYYAYVVALCTYTIQGTVKRVIYLVTYHILLYMFVWTYFKTLSADIAVVPRNYKIPRNLYEQLRNSCSEEKKNKFLVSFCDQRDLNIITRNVNGYIRFCKKCKHIKPDRAHHCSKCGTCVLRMDHHCPWVNNCINFGNYKYFVLYLCYNSLYCVFYAATTTEFCIKFFRDSVSINLHVIVGFGISCSMTVLVLAFTTYHLSLISRNETSLEALYGTCFFNDNLTYDIGRYENFIEVFGDRWYLWFFPVWTTLGDGVHFPARLLF